MYGALQDDLTSRLAEVREEGLYKTELVITTPQSAHVEVEGRGEMLNLCANNYLGLASHPEIVAAAHEALDRWGFGMASVRFICGTQAVHRELEERLSAFLGTEDTILYSSCFDANGGLFEALLGPEDAIVSDALNHASIIDGIRLCKAARHRYANSDLDELEARLQEAAGARYRLIATDGVFSMDGYVAKLDADLRARRAPRRPRDGRRLARRRLRRPARPRHPRAARRHRPRRHPHGHARQGDGRRLRRLRLRAARDRRAAAPALPPVPVLEQRRPARRRRHAQGPRPDRDHPRPPRHPRREHRPSSVGA